MATLDIRDKVKEEITEIKFDDSNDRLVMADAVTVGIYFDDEEKTKYLCEYADIDNMIKALKKAKELWGK